MSFFSVSGHQTDPGFVEESIIASTNIEESQILILLMGNCILKKECTVPHCAESSLEFACYVGIEISKQSFYRPFKLLICDGSQQFGNVFCISLGGQERS